MDRICSLSLLAKSWRCSILRGALNWIWKFGCNWSPHHEIILIRMRPLVSFFILILNTSDMILFCLRYRLLMSYIKKSLLSSSIGLPDSTLPNWCSPWLFLISYYENSKGCSNKRCRFPLVSPSEAPFNTSQVHMRNLWVSSKLGVSVQIWAKVLYVGLPYGVNFNIYTKKKSFVCVSVAVVKIFI